MQLTQKEMMYLKDAQSHEELCIAKYNSYSQQVSCQQLSQLLSTIASQEQTHLQTIQQMMNGQVPQMASGGQGGQQGQQMSQQQSQQSMGAQSQGGMQQVQLSAQDMTDKMICTDLLTTEKAVSDLYDHATFEFTSQQLRQALEHIQKEEHQHAFQLYQYMAQKGWYQAQ